MLRVLDAAHVRRWAVACVQSLDAHREDIDRINVFPVPDCDTGSNLLHTMRAALDALLRAPAPARTDAYVALSALAKGALTGARGNSGVIISQLLRGMADTLTSNPAATPTTATTRTAAGAGSAVAGDPAAAAGFGSASGVADSNSGVGDGPGAGAHGNPARVPTGGADLGSLPDPDDRGVTGVGGRDVSGSGGRALGGDGLRVALLGGAARARVALAEPVPGTMISVLAAAASAAEDEASGELGALAAAAAAAAATALDETPRLLPVLAAAGVVDAGGRGVVVLLDALVAVVSEQPAALAAAQRARTERVASSAEQSMYTARESGSDAFAYEVMYLLADVDGPGDPIGRLRDTLVGLGDCVSVVGDGARLWTVHVHCNDVGAAIEVGVETGRPRQIRVARFADAPSAEASRFVKDRAVVVPARSTEFADLLISEGVTVVHVDEQDDRTAYRLLEAITGSAAAHVTVLPADSTLTEVSDEASIRAVAAGQDVVVVPCASPVQVLAAVAVHDPRRRAGDDVVAMAEAAAATRRGEVVVAAEAAITWIGACEAGDVLGFADGEVVLIEPGPPDVDALDRAACGVVARMLGVGGELVTALLGAGSPDELTDELTDYLRREHPETELVVYHGGQTDAVLIVGVE
ncbi:DAK2 domain-containing protein [Actinophytocola sp.]|uniref:DAK2 domain-containing protein n=1 Tax=Actinophytocola sp. TaxID=1872138 RepID=UPI003D6A365E